MNLNHNKPVLGPTQPAFLNSSMTLINKLNKSRSLLKNSVLRCAMKENNQELARTLAAKESELSEIRRENNLLRRENYDLRHTGQFRNYNYMSYMGKFSEFSDIVISLFHTVCKLSDDLVDMKNHPFLTGDTGDETRYQLNHSELNTSPVPSPFASKDKIPRSPLHLVEESSVTDPDSLAELASCLNRIKNQSSNSINNLSMKVDSNASFVHKPEASKLDLNDHSLTDGTSTGKSKITVRRGLHKKNEDNKIVPKKRTKMSQDIDPMYGSKAATKPKKRKKKDMTLKTETKELDKEAYKKHKEADVYHLSINETLNTTIVPPSLNEFKNQQKVSENNEIIKECEVAKKAGDVRVINEVGPSSVEEENKADDAAKKIENIKQPIIIDLAESKDVVKRGKGVRGSKVVKGKEVIKDLMVEVDVVEVTKAIKNNEIVNDIEAEEPIIVRKKSKAVRKLKVVKGKEVIKDQETAKEVIMPEKSEVVKKAAKSIKNKEGLNEIESKEQHTVTKKRKVNDTKDVRKGSVSAETIPESDQRPHTSPISTPEIKPNNYFDNDDDDFELSNKPKAKKKKNILEESLIEVEDSDHYNKPTHTKNDGKENEIKIVPKKPKSSVGKKRKNDETESKDDPPKDINKKIKDKASQPSKKPSNVSIIIANINADLASPAPDKVKGRNRKR